MAPVVDSHVHIFPYLDEPAGFGSQAEHRQFLQLYMAAHGEPIRRLRDHVQVHEQTLHDGSLSGPRHLRDVRFRVGRFGRFEWTADDEDLYIQFFPPHLQDMTSPAEFMLQQMARAGVEMAVLQNARLYGRLNDIFAAAVRAHPDRFIGLTDVDEPNAGSDREIVRLRHAVRDLGLRGLYYANRGHFPANYAHTFDDPLFDPFWAEVEELRIPVFWELVGEPDPTDPALLLREVERLNDWLDRWRTIPSVWTHGFDPGLLAEMPAPLERLLAREQVSVEILYPIHWARNHEYPFPELRPALATLYQRCGGERLIWGSDMPNVERNCTYRQSLHYLHVIADGLVPPADLDRILGLNVLRLLGVGT
jgi:predicted TIM-barrel fold metal-dependent hydrolase